MVRMYLFPSWLTCSLILYILPVLIKAIYETFCQPDLPIQRDKLTHLIWIFVRNLLDAALAYFMLF